MEEKSNFALDVLREQQEHHREETDKLHTIINRFIVALIVVSALLVGTICYQIYNSYLPTEEVQQDNKDGQNNYIGNNGDINNGKTNDN